MRVTLTIDDDVAAAIERRRRELHHTFEQEVNDLIRAGLAHEKQRHAETDRSVFRIEPLDVGKLLVDNLDDISAVLAIADGENHL